LAGQMMLLKVKMKIIWKIKWHYAMTNMVSEDLAITQTHALLAALHKSPKAVIAPSTDYANAFGTTYTLAVNTPYCDQRYHGKQILRHLITLSILHAQR
jgi:hypothetical protein